MSRFQYMYCELLKEDSHAMLSKLIRQNKIGNLAQQLEIELYNENITDFQLYHLLHEAATLGNSCAVDVLIENGAPVTDIGINRKGNEKLLGELHPFDLMLGAIMSNSPNILSTLISHGASVNQTRGRGPRDPTLVMQCVLRYKPECLSLLIEHGADIHKVCAGADLNQDSGPDNMSYWMRRCAYEDNADLLELSDDRPPWRQLITPFQTPTMAAACLGHLDVLQVFKVLSTFDPCNAKTGLVRCMQ